MSTRNPLKPIGRSDGARQDAVTGPARARVLVIDDDPAILLVVRRALDAHDVVTAGDARQALAILEATSDFDMLLCDVVMPGMSGLQFWSEIALAHPRLVDRIVFMTGGAPSDGQEAFLSSGAVDVLRKPFSFEALHRLVAQRLDDRRR